MDPTQVRGFGMLAAVGLLKPGVSLLQAASEMETITTRLRQQYPETNNRSFNPVVSLQHTGRRDGPDVVAVVWRRQLRAVNRLRECGELTASECGLAAERDGYSDRARRLATARDASVAYGESDAGVAGGAIDCYLPLGRSFDDEVVAAGLSAGRRNQSGLACACVYSVRFHSHRILFGLAPALQISKTDVQESLKESGRGASSGRRHNRLRNLLIVGEVALSVVLLVGAGLLFRSFLQLRSVNTGFTSQQLLTVRLSPAGSNYRRDADFIAFYSQAMQRVSAIPGVEAVGAINTLRSIKGPPPGSESKVARR